MQNIIGDKIKFSTFLNISDIKFGSIIESKNFLIIS